MDREECPSPTNHPAALYYNRRIPSLEYFPGQIMRTRTPIRIFAILSQLVAKGKVKVDPLARHVAKPAGPTLERVNLMVSILILFLSFLSRRSMGRKGGEDGKLLLPSKRIRSAGSLVWTLKTFASTYLVGSLPPPWPQLANWELRNANPWIFAKWIIIPFCLLCVRVE